MQERITAFAQLYFNKLYEKIRRYSLPVLILWAVVITSVLSLLLNLITRPNIGLWLEDWLSDFSTDLAGTGLTFLLIRWVIQQREQERVEQAAPPLTTTFYIEAEEVTAPPPPPPSPVSDEKTIMDRRTEQISVLMPQLKAAATPEGRQLVLDTLKEEDFLQQIQLVDANLQRADLADANLEGADLTKANLRGARLHRANLRGVTLLMAQLIEADVQQADLSGSLLERAYMSGANLRGVNLSGARIQTSLWGVNLQNAILRGTDLRGAELFRADLTGADLTGAFLDGAKINRETRLPDGSSWDGRSDLGRFTNPQHPGYWRSSDPASPAYRGN